MVLFVQVFVLFTQAAHLGQILHQILVSGFVGFDADVVVLQGDFAENQIEKLGLKTEDRVVRSYQNCLLNYVRT